MSGESKTCTLCRMEKPIEEFRLKKRGDRYIRNYPCWKCECSKAAEWARNNPEKMRQNRKRYKEKHVEKLRAYSKEYRYRYDIFASYGITREQYDSILAQQGGVCAICGGAGLNKRGHRLHVDHCHDTGMVRGILCGNCNVAIGMMKESVPILHAAIAYLESHLRGTWSDERVEETIAMLKMTDGIAGAQMEKALASAGGEKVAKGQEHLGDCEPQDCTEGCPFYKPVGPAHNHRPHEIRYAPCQACGEVEVSHG